MSLDQVLILLFIYVSTAIQDTLQAVETAAIAHGRIELAARTDVVKMVLFLWGGGMAIGAVLTYSISVYSIAATVAYAAAGYTGNQVGIRVSEWLERKTGKRVHHKYRIRPDEKEHVKWL